MLNVKTENKSNRLDDINDREYLPTIGQHRAITDIHIFIFEKQVTRNGRLHFSKVKKQLYPN